MRIKRVNIIYFSPTGNTRKILQNIAKGIGNEIREYNLTKFDARWDHYKFEEDELVILGMPVYGGRLPGILTEFFRGIRATKTPAVYVVSYGNRDFDDALLELKNNCEEKGFVGLAAGAFVAEHSFTEEIAGGRPDEQDVQDHISFGKQVKNKLESMEKTDSFGALEVRGNYPYKKPTVLPIGPSTHDTCDDCGICIEGCPVSAINPSNAAELDGLRCIDCFACIRNCPKQSKYMGVEIFNEHIDLLIEMCVPRKETEIFI